MSVLAKCSHAGSSHGDSGHEAIHGTIFCFLLSRVWHRGFKGSSGHGIHRCTRQAKRPSTYTSARDATYAPHDTAMPYIFPFSLISSAFQADRFSLTWLLMQKEHPTTDECPLHEPRRDMSILTNNLDFLQSVQRLTDEEVRHSRETRPLAPSSYPALGLASEPQAWRMPAAQAADNISMRRNRQTIHGNSSSATAAVAPSLYQQETVRSDSEAETSTQFGGTAFVGGSTVRFPLLTYHCRLQLCTI